jgi:hydroxymethylbilane synthase
MSRGFPAGSAACRSNVAVTLTSTELRIATRKSPLALWQANHVAQLLRQVEPALDVVMVPSDTFADLDLTTTIAQLGGKGAFSKEIQQVVLAGHADLAVHSAKDLQALTPDGLVVAAYPERGDPRDALVGVTTAKLDEAVETVDRTMVVATGSNRRRALLRARHPQIGFCELRGNIATRLARLEAIVEHVDAPTSAPPPGDTQPIDNSSCPDGLIMAAVALERLGLAPRTMEILDPVDFVPQVGQGALAVEVPAERRDLRDLVAKINHPVTAIAVEAERSFLAELGGDCTLPAGAHATVAAADGQVRITIRGILADEHCTNLQRHVEVGVPSAEPGRVLARALRKRLEAAV